MSARQRGGSLPTPTAPAYQVTGALGRPRLWLWPGVVSVQAYDNLRQIPTNFMKRTASAACGEGESGSGGGAEGRAVGSRGMFMRCYGQAESPTCAWRKRRVR